MKFYTKFKIFFKNTLEEISDNSELPTDTRRGKWSNEIGQGSQKQPETFPNVCRNLICALADQWGEDGLFRILILQVGNMN